LLVGSAVFVGAVSIVTGMIAGDDSGFFAFIINIVSTVLMWWFFLGFTRMALTISTGGVPHFNMLFGESWDVLWKYAVASIVSGIIVVIGLVLLIVPGIIAQIMLSLMVFMILEKGLGPIESLKASKRLTEGKKWDLLLFFLLAVALSIAGAIPMGLGL